MSRAIRLVLAAGLLGGLAAPLAAHASNVPPFPYSCTIRWEPIITTSPNLPPVTIYRPWIACYG